MTSPHTAGRTESPLANEILSLWKMGQYDTDQIARRVMQPEHVVYRVVAGRNNKPIATKAPPKRARSILKPVVTPKAKAPANCSYRLRNGSLYLHQSGETTTPDRKYAWQGTAKQAVACCTKFPVASNMEMELVL